MLSLLLLSVNTKPLAGQQSSATLDGPDTVATFYGTAIVFTGDPASGLTLQALVGEGSETTLCGRATVGADGTYTIAVASAASYRGCGRSGDDVRFWLGSISSLALGARASVIQGLPAAPTGTFQAGQVVQLDLRRASPPSGPLTRPFGGRELVRLAPGCTNVVLTWPDGMAIEEIAGVVRSVLFPDPVSPPLVAIWRYDTTLGRFSAWSPLPGAPVEIARVNELDAVFICVQTAAFLLRPTR